MTPMLDIAVAYNRYRFLGDEFLTWIWFLIDTDEAAQVFRHIEPELSRLEIGDRIVLENRRRDSLERITIRGEDANLVEGRLSLQKGALVTEMSLEFHVAEQQWQFSIKGESLNISSLKTPKVGPAESSEDLEGLVLEKVYLYDKVLQFIEKLFIHFVTERLSPRWEASVVPAMRAWVRAR